MFGERNKVKIMTKLSGLWRRETKLSIFFLPLRFQQRFSFFFFDYYPTTQPQLVKVKTAPCRVFFLAIELFSSSAIITIYAIVFLTCAVNSAVVCEKRFVIVSCVQTEDCYSAFTTRTCVAC